MTGPRPNPDGDKLISGHECRLWSLVRHVLHEWGTLVAFRAQSYDFPGRLRGYVTFFVPLDSPARDEIVAFLERELGELKADDWEWLGETYPGTDISVDVVHFSGIDPYVTVEEGRRIVEAAVEECLARLERARKATK